MIGTLASAADISYKDIERKLRSLNVISRQHQLQQSILNIETSFITNFLLVYLNKF